MPEKRNDALRAVLVLLAAALAILPSLAEAKVAVALESSVFVERADPQARRTLEPARQLSRGDRIVYLVTWKRQSGSGSFVVTNPLPPTVYYQASADEDEQVSIDGGRTWGRLEMMHVGRRLAAPEDVTHVRWRISAPVAARGSGQIAYSAIVR